MTRALRFTISRGLWIPLVGALLMVLLFLTLRVRGYTQMSWIAAFSPIVTLILLFLFSLSVRVLVQAFVAEAMSELHDTTSTKRARLRGYIRDDF